jgi:hypothetical protein
MFANSSFFLFDVLAKVKFNDLALFLPPLFFLFKKNLVILAALVYTIIKPKGWWPFT